MNADSKLTEGSIRRHLIRLSIPASTGLIFNTLYNLTDFWFAGLLSDNALAGVSIAGSIFFLLLAVGIGMQAGTSAVAAPEVGAERLQEAGKVVDNALAVAIVLSLLVMFLGWLFVEPLIGLLGAKGEVASLANTYLVVVFCGAFFFILSFVTAGALMAHGDTRSNRNVLAVGFFVNLALNPLLTFTFGLGVAGLALATVIIKLAGSVYLLYKLKQVYGRWNMPEFDLRGWFTLLKQVLPASFNMLTIILGGFITVALIGRTSSQHVAGYAVGLRLEQVLLLPALGLNSAIMALAGQNFGAEFHDRVKETYRAGLWLGLLMAGICIPVMILLSPLLMRLFSDDPVIVDTGTAYLRIDALAYFPYVVLFISTACLQAIKQPLFPMFLGIIRQLVLPASINYVLIVIFGFPMITIFITIVVVVFVAAIVSHYYTDRQLVSLH